MPSTAPNQSSTMGYTNGTPLNSTEYQDNPPSYTATMTIDNVGGVPSHPAPSTSASTRRVNRILAMLGSLLFGGGIVSISLYGIMKAVEEYVRYMVVKEDPEKWMNAVRTEYYDRCYVGCDGCGDPSYSYKACKKTAEILRNNPNITCDGTKIWYWEDRYPQACLEAGGQVLYNKALTTTQRAYQAGTLSIVLVFMLGCIVFIWGYKWWSRKLKERAQARVVTWPRERSRSEYGRYRAHRARTAAIALMAMAPQATSAYACSSQNQTAHEYFTNRNQTVLVHVHSWFSDCVDGQRCRDPCVAQPCDPTFTTWKCPPGLGGPSCDEDQFGFCERVAVPVTEPQDNIDRILPQILRCGFDVSETAFPNASLRLANPGFEKHWWVKVDVNGYNITDPQQTDEDILCLHAIGNEPPTNQTPAADDESH